MGNLKHDASTVACLVAGLGPSMFHIFQHTQCLIYQFMALVAMDVDHHAYTARVMFIV